MLRSFIVRKKSELHRYGLCTLQPIQSSEVIHDFTPDEFSAVNKSQILKWSERKKKKFLHFAFQIDDDWYLYKKNDISFFMNHSCNPNCWFQVDNKIVAKRNIKSMEELTIDYATLMSPSGLDYPFNCKCGASDCRKIISKYDCNLPAVQKKYYGHFLSFINKIIEQKNQSNYSTKTSRSSIELPLI